MKKLYAEIAKVEEQNDGTIKVWGYASSEAVDSDGETVTADAMKAALPDYMKFGAVREMHQAKAAGTAIEAEVQEDGRTFFGAHVVDAEAVKKVKANVYKGFSIGGKVTSRDDLNKSVIKGLKLIEVSLVDRPANPEAVFTMYKAETLDPKSAFAELADLLNKGEVDAVKLLEIAKAHKAEAPPEEKIEKGMWSVQDFAGVLSSISWICSNAQDELAWEGDNSPVPAKLRAWLAQGIEIFKAMANEELAELLSSLKEQAGEVEVITLAAKAELIAKAAQVDEITKAGARFSKSTKDALGAIHKAAKEACDHLDKLGYADAEETEEKSAGAGDLKKLHGDLDAAKADLAKVAEERDALQKRITELESRPAEPKGVLKVIGKGEDVQDLSKGTVEPVKNADGSENTAASLIKAAHAQGGKRITL